MGEEEQSAAQVQRRIRGVFAAAGARGFLHVQEIGRPTCVEVHADAPVALASVVKVVVAVAFARAVVSGELDPTEPVTVPRTLQVGGTGTAGCADAAVLSLRDLALFMMSMSDNAATDVVWSRVGHAALDAVVSDLGLGETRVRGDMGAGHRSVVAELGLVDARDLDASVAAAGEAARDLAWVDPQRANASTARDTSRLLEAVWTDRAGSPQACALVRSLMSHQVTSHRLASGFDDTVVVRSKTGTLPLVRNEAGVVEDPDGRRYVASVFTRAHSLADRQPAVDRAIGVAARTAVDWLRAQDA